MKTGKRFVALSMCIRIVCFGSLKPHKLTLSMSETSKDTEKHQEDENSKHLMLPRPRIERALRKQFASRRMSSGVAVYTTAALDTLFADILAAANKEAAISRKKRITLLTLLKSVRADPNLSKMFQNYSFFQNHRLTYDALELMTKVDRQATLKARAEAKKQKQSIANAPAVDED